MTGDVRTRDDLVRADGQDVTIYGRYEAIRKPIRGGDHIERPTDHATVVLTDGTVVFLEPLYSDAATRPPEELARYDGVQVRARGTIHKIMPARGESLIDPCLAGVQDVEEDL